MQFDARIDGQPHQLTIAHENAGFSPANRAWLPLGLYLRTNSGPLCLPDLPAGSRAVAVRPEAMPPPPLLKLKLQVQHQTPLGHGMLRWTDEASTQAARNVA